MTRHERRGPVLPCMRDRLSSHPDCRGLRARPRKSRSRERGCPLPRIRCGPFTEKAGHPGAPGYIIHLTVVRSDVSRLNVLKQFSAAVRRTAMDARVEVEMRAHESPEPGVVAASVYAGGRCISDIAINEAGNWSKKPGHVVWIGLFEPSYEL